LTSIRTAGPAEAAVIAALHVAAFGEPWRAEDVALLLATYGSAARLAVDAAGLPVGFVVLRHAGSEAEIVSIGVDPGRRRGGVGAALLTAAVEAAGLVPLFLEVAEDNLPARALYRRAGFAAVGRRRAYYARPGGASVDAIVMRRDVPVPTA
jgi:ribosomal-protein-alanine N-acetyltransferase